MDKKQKEKISIELEKIIKAPRVINEEMEKVPHSGGIAHRILKSRDGMQILHRNKGFLAQYGRTGEELYLINIYKMSRG